LHFPVNIPLSHSFIPVHFVSPPVLLVIKAEIIYGIAPLPASCYKTNDMQPIQHISIPNPCNASWQGMTPVDNGRHCIQCAKTVIDFTTMTDSEVINYIQASGKACGRFSPYQLNRINNLVDEKPRAFAWKGLVAAASLLATIPATKAEAKVALAIEQSATPKQLDKETVAADSTNRIIIKGKVIDGSDKTGLPGVAVCLKGYLYQYANQGKWFICSVIIS
jgi:hypothetical protein